MSSTNKESIPSHELSGSHEWPEPPDSRECHEGLECLKCPEAHVSLKLPESPVCPVSEGQDFEAIKEKVLKIAAASRACTEHNTARKQLWELLRDLRGVEEEVGREFTPAELMLAFDEWHQRSEPLLDPAKTRDDYLAKFFAGLGKVRVPTGQGDALNKALEAVSKLSLAELPVIPGMPEPSESWRRLAALHRELSRRSTNKQKTYFLSYRDAAKAAPELSHQQAHDMTLTLERFRVIDIVSKGKAGLNSRKAAEFRYLLPL